MRASFSIIFCLALIGCENQSPISAEYETEMTALDQKGGAGLPYYVGTDLNPVWNRSPAQIERTRKLSPFELKDQTGKAVRLTDLDGKIAIVSFFYSHCPGICPQTTRNLKEIQKKFKNEKQVVMVSFSLTPEKDTPKVLDTYAKKNEIDFKKWHLLTGSRKEIYHLARESFNEDTFSRMENAQKPLSKEDFLHSENVYLLDQNQQVRGVYAGMKMGSILELARDTETLLK